MLFCLFKHQKSYTNNFYTSFFGPRERRWLGQEGARRARRAGKGRGERRGEGGPGGEAGRAHENYWLREHGAVQRWTSSQRDQHGSRRPLPPRTHALAFRMGPTKTPAPCCGSQPSPILPPSFPTRNLPSHPSWPPSPPPPPHLIYPPLSWSIFAVRPPTEPVPEDRPKKFVYL